MGRLKRCPCEELHLISSQSLVYHKKGQNISELPLQYNDGCKIQMSLYTTCFHSCFHSQCTSFKSNAKNNYLWTPFESAQFIQNYHSLSLQDQI